MMTEVGSAIPTFNLSFFCFQKIKRARGSFVYLDLEKVLQKSPRKGLEQLLLLRGVWLIEDLLWVG